MSVQTLAIVGHAGDIMRRCERLLELAQRLDRLVDGTEETNPWQENKLGDVNRMNPHTAQAHLDMAFAAVQEWLSTTEQALGRRAA